MLQINNKFNIGDTVYVMYANKIKKGIIDQIRIYVYEDDVSIYYNVEMPYDMPLYREESIFSTPEELSNSLLNTIYPSKDLIKSIF